MLSNSGRVPLFSTGMWRHFWLGLSRAAFVVRIRYMPETQEQEVVKLEPKSKGLTGPRKKKPKELAIITEFCTGCAGSPACVDYCPVEDCMYWVPDLDHPPFGRIEVDPYLCIGCKKCTSKGPDGSFLDGCPWDAIEMLPTSEWEAEHGVQMKI